MPHLQQYYAFGKYNQLMNEKLYAADLLKMTDEQRRQNMQAFFKSLHGTLEHILVADLIWLRRLQNLPALKQFLSVELVKFPIITNLNQGLHDDFNALWQDRQRLDHIINTMMDFLSHEMLLEDFCYTNLSGTQICNKLWVFLSHLFNHQTHHRGQATTLLAQFHIDIGVTDFHSLLMLCLT